MRSFRSKPVGWQHESHRHYLAAKGISTKYYAKFRPLTGIVNVVSDLNQARKKDIKRQSEDVVKKVELTDKYTRASVLPSAESMSMREKEQKKSIALGFAPTWVVAEYNTGSYDNHLNNFIDASNALRVVDKTGASKEEIVDLKRKYNIEYRYFKRTSPTGKEGKKIDPFYVPKLYGVDVTTKYLSKTKKKSKKESEEQLKEKKEPFKPNTTGPVDQADVSHGAWSGYENDPDLGPDGRPVKKGSKK
jgi:hypothetical protein